MVCLIFNNINNNNIQKNNSNKMDDPFFVNIISIVFLNVIFTLYTFIKNNNIIINILFFFLFYKVYSIQIKLLLKKKDYFFIELLRNDYFFSFELINLKF